MPEHEPEGPQHTAPEHPAPSRRRRPPTLVILLGVAVVVIVVMAAFLMRSMRTGDSAETAITVASSPSTTPPAIITMRGTISMDLYDDPKTQFRTAHWRRIKPIGCEGIGGYDDITEGATITVYGAGGDVIGVGSLGLGIALGTRCTWPVEVAKLPESPFYQVEVSHRGKVTVQRSDVNAVGLTLG